jgi:hypothetical protein
MKKLFVTIILMFFLVGLCEAATPVPPAPSKGLKVYTVATLPSASANPNLAVIVTDGNAIGDCVTGSGSTRNICVSDGTNWGSVGDGVGGAGSGSVTTIESGDSGVGDADIVTIDFSTALVVTETPNTEINVTLEATLVDIMDGTIAENLVNTANPWADNEVADDITITNISQVADISATAAEINTPLDGASVTLTEFQELEAIGATTISASQWAALGGIAETLAAAELDILDGATFNVTEANQLATIGATTVSANQWALLGGVAETLGAAELNLLDGETAVLSDIVEDTTPQLGGPLDINNKVVFDAANAFGGADTTPDVSGGTVFKTADTSTYTDFDDGTDHTNFQDGRQLVILAQHAAILDCSASQINCNEGSNLTLADGDIVQCFFDDTTDADGQWVCMSSNDNDTGGATAWSSIGDAASAGTIAFSTYKQTITSTIDAASGAALVIDHTDADGLANNTYLLELQHSNDGDSEAHFMRGLDNNTDELWSIAYDGTATFKSIATSGSSNPGFTFNDSNAAGAAAADKDAGGIFHNMSTTTEDAEVSDFRHTFLDAGTERAAIVYDGSAWQLGFGVMTDDWTMGDVAGYESLKFDFDTATDAEINISSPSGGHTITAAQAYGSFHQASGAATWILPAVASGMSTCVYSTGANAVVVDPNASDRIVLNGTALADGDSITSASAAGDFICLIADSASGWTTLGRSGTWTDTN